jgi:glutamate/tyrosine decarboxylase-like PLP-dependent enzyme
MDSEKRLPLEENLDPRDWEQMRILGHRMVDEMLDYIQGTRERPVWQPASDQVKRKFDRPLPLEPQSRDDIYQEFIKFVLPYPIGNTHPRFWGWVFGTGTPFGVFAEFLAGAMNTNSGDMDHHSANHVEKQVLTWIKEMLSYPSSASGLFTSGCSAANLIGLTVARNALADFDLRREGINSGDQRMVLYASQEIHSSIQKAVEILGLGSRALRFISTNADFQINIEELRTSIQLDRSKGYLPFCVVGAAGTTNTGAIDDLDAMSELCQSEGLWLHVDGAFGAWAAIAPGVQHMVSGMEKADSLAFDLHKWMYMPYEIGCILVRDPQKHRQAFFLRPDYLARVEPGRGITGGDLPWMSDYGFQLSRRFNALKAWMSIKEHGSRKYSRLIQQNIDQAQYVAEKIASTPELELLAPVPLNVVCFRYRVDGIGDADLDKLNQRILVELQEGGLAVVSGTRINEKFALHLANTNHRSRREDFDLLLQEVIRLGAEISAGWA